MHHRKLVALSIGSADLRDLSIMNSKVASSLTESRNEDSSCDADRMAFRWIYSRVSLFSNIGIITLYAIL